MAKVPITARPHVFYIRPAPGWLELLHQEVIEIISQPIQKYKFEPKVTLLKGTVKIHRCDWRQGLEVMLRLTTAHDVEWMLLESKCTKWSEAEAILKRTPWNEVLPVDPVLVHVAAEVNNGFTTASGKLRDTFCKISGVNHVSEGGKIRFKIELRNDFLRISASLCGDPLYKRGYKVNFSATAPLPEHHAAACIRWALSGLPLPTNIIVPFAGSGTLGFESILVLSGSGPGAFSRSFSCELFPGTPEPTMGFLRRKLSDRLSQFSGPLIQFNDFNANAISMLKENAQAFPFNQKPEIHEGNFFQWQPKISNSGSNLILLNPPYGDRLSEHSSIVSLYSRIASHLYDMNKQHNGRIQGAIICPDEVSWKTFRRDLKAKSDETHHFTHGGKEMRLVRWRNL